MAAQGQYIGAFKDIVEVGWATKKTLVLEFWFTRNQARPEFPMSDLDVSPAIDVFDSDIRIDNGKVTPVPAVANPITTDMRKALLLWDIPPVLHSSQDGSDGCAVWFFNLAKIKLELDGSPTQYSFKIHTPAAGTITIPGTTSYWVWYDWGDPFPGVAPWLFYANISFDSVWGTLAEAQARADELSVHSGYHVEAYTGPDEEVSDSLHWYCRATTYTALDDFPVDADNVPQWSGAWIESLAEQESGSGPFSAATLTVTVNFKTLEVAITV